MTYGAPLKKLAALACAAVAALSMAACSTEDKPDAKPAPSSSSPADYADTGIPPEPKTGEERLAYLEAIAEVDPSLTADPDKAIDAGRNQCSSLDGGGKNVDHTAAQRFGSDVHQLTDEQGAELNKALRKTLCPAS